jgi:dipeptidyl aminopeptidase/acylaminoacyl peptidase
MTELAVDVYERAERLLPLNRPKLVRATRVRPQWIDGARFWYRVDGPEGHSFVAVDPVAGTREAAFDHERLARALAAASGLPADKAALPFRSIVPKDGAVEFFGNGVYWRCRLDSYACQQVDDFVRPSFLEASSPDRRWVVFRRNYDLWVRSAETGEERALTTDGVAEYAYGVQADSLAFKVLFAKLGLPHLPPLVAWSPDSRHLLTHRTDQRAVPLQHVVEAAPADGGPPALRSYHYGMPGDEGSVLAELLVIDVETGTVRAAGEPLVMSMGSPIGSMRAWWAPDGSAVYYLDGPRDRQTIGLKRLDPYTGESRTMLQEHGEPWVDANQVVGGPPVGRVLSDHEVLWWSQRDGWGHLYLYDGKGELQNRVTEGEWIVQQVLHVDPVDRVVTFVASGLVTANPYLRQVCRVGLDGSGFARVTDDELDHAVVLSPDAAFFVDTASTHDTPPATSVRRLDGEVIVELERTDVSLLRREGWSPPDLFRVKAADGETDIYGLLYLPVGFDPAQRYPVLDHPYPGPHMARMLPGFDQSPAWDSEAVASLGFVVMALNGRGTPGRNKAFHDHNHRNIGNVGLDDHVAAIRQLAETRPWMDTERVGIFGLSRGGGRTARAMFTYPEVYKVGVAEAGAYDVRFYQQGVIEAHNGPLDAETYARSAEVEIADRLKGKLLLVHGGIDDNTHPHQTLRLVERLIAANKDFELLIVPGAEHLFVGYEPYVTRRRWDFLVRHLLGLDPPAGYRLADSQLDFESFAEMFG